MRSWAKRALVVVLVPLVTGTVTAAVAMYAVGRAVGNTVTRARSIHSGIRAGMTAGQVSDMLSKRDFSFYVIRRDGQSPIDTDLDAFVRELRQGGTLGEMRVHIMGSTPYRVSFSVMFGVPGIVTGKSAPKGWD